MIEETARTAWQSLNWKSLAPDEVALQWRELQREDEARRFILETAPLSRVSFLTLPGGTSHVLWSFPGILLDETSVWQVVEEILAIYEIRSRNEEPQFTPSLSWMEYLASKEESPSGLQEFRGPGEATSLPFENTQPGDSQFARVSLEIDRELGKACSALAREFHIAPEQFARAAWALTLGRLNASDDVLFWEIRGDRGDAAIPVGRASTLVLHHVQLDPGARVRDWMRSFPAPCLASPSRGMRTVLEVHRSNGAGVLADRMPRWIRTDAILKRPVHGSPTLICRLGDRPSLELLFDAGVLAPDRAEATLKYFSEALRELTANPGHLLCQLGIVPPEETERILAASRGPARPALLRISPDGLLREASLLQAGRTAVESPSHTLSYDELHAHVGHFANYLTAQKYGDNFLAAVALAPSSWLPVALLGLWSARAAVLPVNKGNAESIAGNRFKRDRLALVLTDSASEKQFPSEPKSPLLVIDNAWPDIIAREGAAARESNGEMRAWLRAGPRRQ